MKKCLLLSFIFFVLFSCSNTDSNVDIVGGGSVLKVQTNAILDVTFTNAKCVSVVTLGQNALQETGVCWSTSQNPTISGSHSVGTLSSDNGGASYVSLIGSLLANTTYYARAYATDANGTVYGTQISFNTLGMLSTLGSGVTDVDGQNYGSVVINGKEWMKKNLNVTKYKNGDVIPQVTDIAQWDALTTGAWCYYENDTANGTVYGKLYNWYAVNDPRGLAPNGWHVPTDTEWTSLISYLGGENVAGMKLKDDTNTYWTASNNIYSTNQSGFTALPAGTGYLNFYLVSGTTYTLADIFKNKTNVAYFWSTTTDTGNLVWSRNVASNSNNVVRSSCVKKSAFSVRCVKN